MPIVLDGTQGISTPMYAGSISSNPVTPVIGMKNKIINGACVIDQRNAGASVTPTASTYTLDRWQFQCTQASKVRLQQESSASTGPVGFQNYIGMTSLSAYSVLTSDFFALRQGIEGFNTADLQWGTANAKTVTLSFWVNCTLTGTFGGSIVNNANNRSYPFTYTINSANAWEQKTITIAGDTTGTWVGATNGIGLNLYLGLGVGATYRGTAGAWSAGNYVSATGATSLVGTNGAVLYLTGVQLEVGSTATSFDYRPYGTELALCQRYYYLHVSGATSLAICNGFYANASNAQGLLTFPVTMRATPTTAIVSGTSFYATGTSNNLNSFSLANGTPQTVTIFNNTQASGTSGVATSLLTNNASAFVAFTAEL